MGCVSSSLLNNDDDFSQIGGSASALGHHIVSLTSTTYGLLSLDPPPDQSPTLAPTPPPRFTLGSLIPSPLSEPRLHHLLRSSSDQPDVINSWELMAGLDPESSSRFFHSRLPIKDKENSNPNFNFTQLCNKLSIDGFEKLCPPNGEDKVVIYTTTLRGVRKTFEDCNAVRAALEGLGVSVCERDIWMDVGFREELRELMKGKTKGGNNGELVPPRVFVKGRYLGGAEEVMRIVEEEGLGELLQGLPKLKAGYVCEGCGGARFLPCFTCNGSCKMVVVMAKEKEKEKNRSVVVKCSDCNENGLVLCPICS